MPPQNKIALKQLRVEEISGLIYSIVTGVIAGDIAALTGNLNLNVTGYSLPLPSGSSSLSLIYGNHFGGIPKVGSTVGCSGLSTAPLLYMMMTQKNATGVTFELSDIARTTGYYADLVFTAR